MPGLIVFRRRWSVGSDDLVVPGLFLFTIHLIWIIILSVSFLILDYDVNIYCIHLLWLYKLGYMGILVVSMFIELAICIVSMRGSILDTSPRASMHYWLYIKFVVILIDLAWLSLGIVWLIKFYMNCSIGEAKEIMLGLVISNWMIFLSILVTIWCTFDAAGRSWVKMKQYQRSMKESESRFNYKRSGSMNRNWRQRKVIRAYQDSWDHRCRLLFCCMGTSERNRNSFADIAKLLSDFFRELDVVPSDVVAGLVLLRKFQKVERQAIVRQKRHGTYEFLSGVPITERTQFLALNDNRDYDHFQTVIYYMHYAMGAYGWPMFLMTHSTTGVCQLCSEFRCCMSCCGRKETPDIIEDNCCYCNYTALKRMISVGDVEIIYTTFHVDVGETPFFVAIDYTKSKIVISIRGTLSMKDVLTDLNAEGEVLPLTPPREDWLGHKGMVQAAVYIRNKLFEHNLIQRSMLHNQLRNTHQFGLVLVGHSLGAGTASILAVLLRQDYPSIQCFSYSPPGGLLSMPVVEYTKSFITSVVVGKDVVPRIGLHQMEALRADLINAIKRSIDPKWKTIACTMICCCCGPQPTSVVEMGSHDANVNVYGQQRNTARKASTHPNDSSIALTLHHPLYPPGRIIHIVRHHPTADEQVLKSHEPVYQAIWVDNTDFDEVLISPAMIQDHMPDTVLAALNKVVTTYGPRKPQRHSSNANSSISSDVMDISQINPLSASSPPPQHYVIGNGNNFNVITPTTTHKVCLETSFTSLHSPLENQSGGGGISISGCGGGGGGGGGGGTSSKTSSLAGSLFGRNQLNSILQYDVSSIVDDSLTTRSPSMPSEATTVVLVEHNLPYHYQTQIPQTTTASSSTTSTQFYHPHPHHHSHQNYRGKNVAFDNRISITPTPSPTLNSAASPNVIPKSILHRQITSAYEQQSPLLTKPQLQHQIHSQFLRCHLFGNTPKIDLVHDDWYGMAPLASPETLSEISSISSRTSLIYNINDNNHNNHHNSSNNINKHTNNYTDHYLPNVINSNSSNNDCNGKFNSNNNNNNNNKINNTMNENISDETQMHTPKVMRRTPKVSDNLATCADNLRLVDSYKRMGKIFISNSSDIQSNSNNNSSQGSFDLSDPISISSKEKSDDDDDYDGVNRNIVIPQSEYFDRLNMENVNVLKNLDEKIKIEKSLPFKIFNSNLQISNRQQNQPPMASSSMKDIHSKPMVKNTNFLESHFPVFYNELSSSTPPPPPPPKVTLSSSVPMEQLCFSSNNNITENTILLSPSSPQKINENLFIKNKTITFSSSTLTKSDNNNTNNFNINKKRNTSEDQCFSRNESLPLLSNLSEKSSPTNFVKRKKMVFPMNTSAASAAASSTRRNESNV